MATLGWISRQAVKDIAIGSDEIDALAITTEKVNTNAITAAKLAPNAAQAGYYGQTNVSLYGSVYYG